ncbi:MAG TPA: type IV toxin-antitoxin system AbiEi family antitoxin domain-containing protein [Solirubrobacterales bacterium]|nr:type IV toxin-antitoxin system AbiEi family antitoxin domain-containing protein [Solirubrobacterales bacterium]
MGSEKHTGSASHAIARLAERQHGVISRRQLLGLGLSEREITVRATSGSLHHLFRGTFAVGHRVIGRRGRMLAAVLASGEGAVLSHGSAAELLDLWDKRPIPVDVIAPSQSGRKIQDIRWHNVRRPLRDEVEIRAGIPCTTVSRTLVDMAGRTSYTSLRRLVEQAAVLRQLEVREVDRVLARGRRRGAPNLRAILQVWRTDDERKPLLRSPLEARLLPALLERGVPPPECNVKLRIDSGKPVEADMLWRDRRLVIEADGEETHGTREAFQSDRHRAQRLVAAGYRVAGVTWRQAEDETAAVVARIRRMLRLA